MRSGAVAAGESCMPPVAARECGGADAAAPQTPAAAAAAESSGAEAAAADGGAWVPAVGARCEARWQASKMPRAQVSSRQRANHVAPVYANQLWRLHHAVVDKLEHVSEY